MPNLLEVIVTSVEEAREAEAGGADRLELVRSLDLGGLTPPIATVVAVLDAVSIPVRVMLRENATLAIGDHAEVRRLQSSALELAKVPIDGLVLGSVTNRQLDLPSMAAVLEHVPGLHVTCHRAFEEVLDPLRAIEDLKRLGQVDRILTSGGEGPWPKRTQRLVQWQTAAAPEIKILTGIGICASAIDELKRTPAISEMHVGRAARIPQTNQGALSREKVAALKSALG